MSYDPDIEIADEETAPDEEEVAEDGFYESWPWYEVEESYA